MDSYYDLVGVLDFEELYPSIMTTSVFNFTPNCQFSVYVKNTKLNTKLKMTCPAKMTKITNEKLYFQFGMELDLSSNEYLVVEERDIERTYNGIRQNGDQIYGVYSRCNLVNGEYFYEST
jgi:hypothetical protein